MAALMPLFRRKDGDLVRDVPPYRRMMPLLMRRRGDATVFFEQHIDAGPALAFLEQKNAAGGDKLTLQHLLMFALVKTLTARPRLNRFTMGGRLYQRRGIFISFSAKKSMSDDAPVFVVKRRFEPGHTLAELAANTRVGIGEGRSEKPTHVDKEIGFFLKFPLFILSPAVRFIMWLDQYNLLPFAFFRDDPLYASVFIANLGSIRLDAAFHHNYEYGNIPIFVTIGQTKEVPYVQKDGTLGVRKQLLLRWTLDERIEDGLYCARALELVREYLENPREA
jgi:2-oxoacid dehydrogenases acyltransferase (catalytic domain)